MAVLMLIYGFSGVGSGSGCGSGSGSGSGKGVGSGKGIGVGVGTGVGVGVGVGSGIGIGIGIGIGSGKGAGTDAIGSTFTANWPSIFPGGEVFIEITTSFDVLFIEIPIPNLVLDFHIKHVKWPVPF